MSLREAIASLPKDEANIARLAYVNIAREADHYALAAEFTPHLSPDDPEAIKAVSQLSSHWAHHDPKAATAWVESLPIGPLRSWAAKNAAAQWARQNPDAAERWQSSLPDAFLPPDE